MDEKKYQWKILLSLVVVVICAGLYSFGGIEHKYLRRFIAPSICAIYLALCNKDPMQLIKAPLLGISSSLGYGSDEQLFKIMKRAYVGLAFGLSASSTDIIKSIRENKKYWFVVGYTTFAVISAYIIFGVWNPLHARVEESLLGMIVYTMAILPSIRR